MFPSFTRIVICHDLTIGVPETPPGLEGLWHLPAADGRAAPVVDGNSFALTIPDQFVTIFNEGAQTTGKRYFEYVADDITRQSIMGFIVDRKADELEVDMYGDKESDRWVGIYDGSGGEAAYYTDHMNDLTSTNFGAADWPEVKTGTVLGFALDLDVGRLDALYIDGVKVTLDPDDPDAFALINSWPANQPVRPFYTGRSNRGAPLGAFTVRLGAEDIQNLPGGYQPWLGEVIVPPEVPPFTGGGNFGPGFIYSPPTPAKPPKPKAKPVPVEARKPLPEAITALKGAITPIGEPGLLAEAELARLLLLEQLRGQALDEEAIIAFTITYAQRRRGKFRRLKG